jgi:arylsulfatase A-like enzyme
LETVRTLRHLLRAAGLTTAAVIAMTLSGCAPASTTADSSTAAKAELAGTKAEPQWTTSENTDEMTNVKTRYASIESTDKFDNQFHSNEKPTEITIRYRGKRAEVMIENTNLQILCNEYDPPLLVKFDNGKAQRFSCTESATRDYGVGFIENAPRFIAQVSKAKAMMIQATVFQRGMVTSHFSLPPLPPGFFTAKAEAHVKKTTPDTEGEKTEAQSTP